jgi:hypothetical protein
MIIIDFLKKEPVQKPRQNKGSAVPTYVAVTNSEEEEECVNSNI